MPARQQKYDWSCTIDTACVAIEMLTGNHVETEELLEYIDKMYISTPIYKTLPKHLLKKTKEVDTMGIFVEFEDLKTAVRRATDGNVKLYKMENYAKVDDVLSPSRYNQIYNPHYPSSRNKFFKYISEAMKVGHVVGTTLNRRKQKNVTVDIKQQKEKVVTQIEDKESWEFDSSLDAWGYLEKTGARFCEHPGHFYGPLTFETFNEHLQTGMDFKLSDFTDVLHAILIKDISMKKKTFKILDTNHKKYKLESFYDVTYEHLASNTISVYVKE